MTNEQPSQHSTVTILGENIFLGWGGGGVVVYTHFLSGIRLPADPKEGSLLILRWSARRKYAIFGQNFPVPKNVSFGLFFKKNCLQRRNFGRERSF